MAYGALYHLPDLPEAHGAGVGRQDVVHHVGVGLGRALGVVGALQDVQVLHGGLGGAGDDVGVIFGPFRPVFALFGVWPASRGRPTTWGRPPATSTAS